MKRVLVTGASGFVGRYCLPMLLERGFEVHAVSSRPSVATGTNGSTEGLCWHVADLFDAAAVNSVLQSVQPSHLLHMAWITEPRRYSHAPENLDWLAASIQLVRAFHAFGGRRVVMTGSCAEYDWTHGWCSEGVTPLQPSTLYGQCKHALQSTLAAYSKQFGFSWGWGRLFFLYGPHGHPARIPGVVIESLLRGEPALCSHGGQIRDFVHIADAAKALALLVDSDVQGPVNVASGEPITIREIVLKIADHVGRRDLVRFGAIQTPPNDPPLVVADVRRLRQELACLPDYSLASGLAATLEWRQGELHG